MKTSKSEIVYLILSILTLIFAAGIYFLFGDTSKPATNNIKTVQNATSDSSKGEDEHITKAKAAIAKLEAAPNQENLVMATTALALVEDQAVVDELQAKLDSLASEVTSQTEAEEAVKVAEEDQTSENVANATAAIEKVSNTTKKAELQSRIDAVSDAIAAQSSYYSTEAYSDYSYTENYVSQPEQ